MSLNRTYRVLDMGYVVDLFSPYNALHYYSFTGTIPAWFAREPYTPGDPASAEHYPTFSFTPPEGTDGTFFFTARKHLASDSSIITAGTVTINVQRQTQPVWKVDGCYSANLVWLDPSGGWESYKFVGKQEPFQDKGSALTFINSDEEKRFHRNDEVHQGTIITTGQIPREHADFIADGMKSIQVFLWETGNTFKPIIITPNTFKKVKTGKPFNQYEFEFRYAKEDKNQTQ